LLRKSSMTHQLHNKLHPYIQFHSTHFQYRNNPIDCNIGLRHKCIHCCHWKEEEG